MMTFQARKDNIKTKKTKPLKNLTDSYNKKDLFQACVEAAEMIAYLEQNFVQGHYIDALPCNNHPCLFKN